MKRLFALFLTAFMLSGCVIRVDPELGEEIKEIIEESDVEVVTVYYHDLYEVNTEYADGRTTREEYTYSEEAKKWCGQYTGCIYYENGRETHREEYTRDKWDNITAITTGTSTTAFDLTYEDYRVVKKVILVDGAEKGWEEYVYNDQGLLTETAVYQEESLRQRTVTEYDETGHCTRITRYDGSGTVTGYDLCTFDGQRCKETVSRYDAADQLLAYWVNGCDVHGNIISQEAYNGEGQLLSTSHRRIGTGTLTGDIERLRTGRWVKND